MLNCKNLFSIACLAAASLTLSAAPAELGWTDEFDNLDASRWEKIPPPAVVAPKDTLSAANRIAQFSPASGQMFFASKDKFIGGDLEMSFSAKPAKPGSELFYYIGFHAYDPWLKSLCWVQIQNDTVFLGVKTSDGASLPQMVELGHIQEGKYHTLKISQSSGKLKVSFDGKTVNFDDPKLISSEAMPVFISANTIDPANPAELRIDYVKVTGKRQPPRLAAREMQKNEKKIIDAAGETIILKSDNADYEWKTDGGLHWGKVDYQGKTLLESNAFVPCFAASVNGEIIYSHELTITAIETTPDRAVFKLLDKAGNISFAMNAEKVADGAIEMSLAAENVGKEQQKVQLIFPIVGSFAPDGDLLHAEYFFPWRSGILGNQTAKFATEYGGFGWMQLQFAYDKKSEVGLMFYPLDTNGRFKGMAMQKQIDEATQVKHNEVVIFTEYPNFELLERQNGLVMAQYYQTDVLNAGATSTSEKVYLAPFNGDWKKPLERYSSWMKQSMHPVDVPRWFRDSFVQACGHPPFYYDLEKKEYVGHDKLAGGEHSLQVAFWDTEKDYGNNYWSHVPGDFQVDPLRGGVEAFAEEIAKTREKGTAYTLYIDYRFCGYDSKTGKAYGKSWASQDIYGNYPGYVTSNDMLLMCFYDQDKWVEYMADTCRRLVKTLGLDGIYLDELGVSFQCYNPTHDHYKRGKFPIDANGLAKSMTKVRNAMKEVNPDAILMTEHAGSDYMTQFYDGSWEQVFYRGAFPFTEKYYSENQLCYFRFYFPHFKLSEWGESEHHVNRSFFNGMGMDMGGSPDTDAQRRVGHAMKENGDALADLTPEPIVPTDHAKLLANRFDADGKVFYTFFNNSDADITGGVLEKAPFANTRYIELLFDEPVEVNSDDRPVITIKPMQVAGVLAVPAVLDVKAEARAGEYSIVFPADAGDELVVCEEYDDEYFHAPRGKSVKLPFRDGKAVYSMHDLNNKKVIFKLKKDGYLIDEVVIKR